MALVGWGKCRLFTCKLDGTGDYPSTEVLAEVPTPVEDSTQLTSTKGDKMEAKIEGGQNEDVKYKDNTYQLVFVIRAIKGRDKPIEDNDGLVADMYAVRLIPEDPLVPGFTADRCVVSVEDNLSTAEGGSWTYTFDVLKPKVGKQIKWGVQTDPTASGGGGGG